MQQLNRPKPDIKVYRSGQIDVRSAATRRMRLDKCRNISFYVDEESNLYIRRDETGLRPTSIHGKHLYRYFSASTARGILSLPDIPKGLEVAGFRLGEPDDGVTFPVITRRVL